MSESKKFDTGKPPISLIPHDYLVAVAEVLAFGAKKYDPHNWRETGFDWSRLIDAAYRHLGAFNDGQDRDPESGLSHVAHLACAVMFLLVHERQRLGNDNRFKKKEAQHEEPNIHVEYAENGRPQWRAYTVDALRQRLGVSDIKPGTYNATICSAETRRPKARAKGKRTSTPRKARS